MFKKYAVCITTSFLTVLMCNYLLYKHPAYLVSAILIISALFPLVYIIYKQNEEIKSLKEEITKKDEQEKSTRNKGKKRKRKNK